MTTKRRKPRPASSSIPKSAVQTVQIPSPATSMIITEPICAKARRVHLEAESARLASEATERAYWAAETKKRSDEKREGVLTEVFGADRKGVLVLMTDDNAAHYVICDRNWRWDGFDFVSCETYLGIPIAPHCGFDSYRFRSLKDLGKALIALDKREAELRALYPNTPLGRLKLWWHRTINRLG